MEEYKRYLYEIIIDMFELGDTTEYITCRPSLDELEDTIHKLSSDDKSVECNYKDGLLHSTYLVDRYEPAIKFIDTYETIINVYLFDGKLLDCIHPCIASSRHVRYYSSERIYQCKPISMHVIGICLYNKYIKGTTTHKIIDEIDTRHVYGDVDYNFESVVHDPIDGHIVLKFAD